MSVCGDCATGRATTAVGMTFCSVCTTGKFAGTMATVCTDCSIGRYQPNTERSVCVQCEEGKTQPLTGQSACSNCGTGTFASRSIEASACTACAAGSFQGSTLKTVCELCAIGKAQASTGQSSCSDCLVGTYTSIRGNSACLACNEGSFLTGSGLSVCVNCQTGRFQSMKGASRCSDCSPGFFSAETGLSVCSLCIAGKFQGLSQQEGCTDCGFGRFASGNGLSVCQSCAVGNFSQFDAGDKCSQCQPGTFEDRTGSQACQACPTGRYQTGVEASACLLCTGGQFQSRTGQQGCSECASGTFQTGSGFSACINCVACSSGQIWGSGCTRMTNGVCQDCQVGTFVSATGRFACEGCAAGTFQAASRGTACQTCQTCLAGRYQGLGCRAWADRECLSCLAGSFSTGSDVSTCTECAAGTFQSNSLATACSACTTCAAGTSWGASCTRTTNAACTPCPAGTFNPSAQTSTCLQCGAGTYQDMVGQSRCETCMTCTEGRYLASGCTADMDGWCETCTICPRATVRACGARTDTVCRTDSNVEWWRMTAYQKLSAGSFMPDLYSVPMIGSTFVKFVDFLNQYDFQAAIKEISGSFVTTFELNLRVVQAGNYMFCMQSDDGGFLEVNGERISTTWNNGDPELQGGCPVRALTAGIVRVYAQHEQWLGTARMHITYRGPDTNNQRVLMPMQFESLPCFWSPRVYPWMGQEQACRPGEYLLSYQPANNTKVCRACPEGWAGLNKKFCERCGVLEEPYFMDRSSCVCRWPAIMNASGACVCPDGLQEVNGTCVACGLNTFGLGGACRPCGAGTFTNRTGETTCQRCEFGRYRLSSQAGGCTTCLPGWFAPQADSSVCIRCNETCATDGWRLDRACPGDSTGRLSVCRPCAEGLPPNASWIRGTECAYACLNGFYRVEGGACQRCTVTDGCPPGRRPQACTEIADFNCDAECVDINKPAVHSHWLRSMNCSWACDYGYELKVWDYVMFQLRECVLTGPTDCPAGRYYDDGQCLACEAGKYQNNTGARSSGDCIACQAGKYSNSSAATTTGVCISCATGKYSNSLSSTSCSECQTRSFTDTTGNTACRACSGGKYNWNTGATICIDCQPPGALASFETVTFYAPARNCRFFQLGGGQPAYLCDGGLYAWVWAGNLMLSWGIDRFPGNSYNAASRGGGSFVGVSTGQQYCMPCEPGRYSSGTACLTCEAGKYQPLTGAVSSGNCLSCEAGKYSNISGATTSGVCTACEAGKFSNKTGANSSTACLACATGTFANTTGNSVCRACTTGKYNPDTGATVCLACQPPGALASFETVTFYGPARNCRFFQLANGQPAYLCNDGLYAWWWAGNLMLSWGSGYFPGNGYNAASRGGSSFVGVSTGQQYCAA